MEAGQHLCFVVMQESSPSARPTRATLWANVVLSPEEVGLEEEDLEDLHDLVGTEIADVLGADTSLHDVFAFINAKAGENAMNEARINQSHKDLLKYFASMILDPDGHQRWMEDIREKLDQR